MKKLTQFAIVTSVLCLLCGSVPRLAVAETRAAWTGGGENNDVLNPDNWSWLEGSTPEGYPDDDTDVILDHTAVDTTLGVYDHAGASLDFNNLAVGNGADRVAYSIVCYTGAAGTLCGGWFGVNNEATVDFKNISVADLHLLPGSTLRVEEDGYLVRYGGAGLGRLSLEGNLDLALPAEPSDEYVIAEYGRLTGQFVSVAGLPPGWRIDYGSGTDDYIRAVPEPSSRALLAAGTLVLAACAWRRRRQRGGPRQLFSTQRISIIRSVTLSLAALVFVGVGQAEAEVSFQGLGHLPGSSGSYARAVSADGSVVVGDAGWTGEAFRWTATDGMVGLGFLTPAGTYSTASDVSADGSMMVGSSFSPPDPSEPFSGEEPVVWTPGGGMVPLFDAPGSEHGSWASVVSADASVVLGTSDTPSGRQIFRWTEAEGPVDLDVPVGSVTGVSADGSVVVGNDNGAVVNGAYRWTEATGAVDLGNLPGNDLYTRAAALSANGAVVVGSVDVDLDGAWCCQAFRWTQEQGMVTLFGSPSWANEGSATAISGNGSVVVGGGFGRPFIWDAVHGPRNLHSVLVDDYGLNLDGWRLEHATDLSYDGAVIVGYGTNPSGHTEAWRAAIPEPSTFALLATGTLGLLLCARRGKGR